MLVHCATRKCTAALSIRTVGRSKRLPGGRRGPQFFPDQVEGLPESVLTADDVPPWPWQQIDSPAQRTKIAGYYNCVHRIDATIGMLTDFLREADHWDDTLIIFLGDHGPPFARGKTSCYEAGLRVPFLARWPGVSEPHVSKRLVGSVDIYPTILDAAGVEISRRLHGRSLRPVLTASDSADCGGLWWRNSISTGPPLFSPDAPSRWPLQVDSQLACR